MENKKVIILGGGVAGMSAAHELSERGFEVHVYEMKKIPGGKARSIPSPGTGTDGRKDLPGEHGFRFFPRFYRHVTDTMSRIPYKNNRCGVFDNLVETSMIEIARFDQPPVLMLAHFPRSLSDVEKLINSVFDTHLGLEPGEREFFAGKVWQLMTSCKARRLNEYERIGWWEFIEAASHSQAYQTFFGIGLTRSLVAAKAETASTKTGGDIFLQLLFDITRPGVSTDRVLNGPTNEVWIEPWLEYLSKKGVKYHFNSRIEKIHCSKTQVEYIEIVEDNTRIRVEGNYYIAALPVEVMSELLTSDLLNLDPTLSGIHQLKQTVAWMNGIQFFLSEDIKLNNGHTIYINSPWALTSISQKQFWQNINMADYGDGKVKTVLSVDISDWETPGILFGKPANQCAPEEVKNEVWAQLKKSLNISGIVLEDSVLHSWFLDPDIVYPNPSKAANLEPLLVNTINSWTYRPDAFTRIPNFFLASDYVKTNTDLATMEGANEAARRAVNGIIDASGAKVPYCKIWDLHEPDLLALWRWKDKQRFRKGLPWKAHFPWWIEVLQRLKMIFSRLTFKKLF